MSYGSITPEILAELARIVGDAQVLVDGDELARYGRDETEDLVFAPDVVVRPADTEQVSAILRLSARARIPVTPRAGGTGLSGGALPVRGGILLSVERMNRIVEIDRSNLVAVVEPGVICETLQNAVEELGLFYPPDPASRGSSQIGGNLAECAGGPHAVKYGTTKDYVLGVEAVLPGGDVIRAGGKLRKNVTGYNLAQLLVGSEGTLAVITKAILRLIPLPTARLTLLSPFGTLEEAAGAVTDLFQHGVVPSACEFMERDAVEAAEAHVGVSFPHHEAAAHLLLEVDGMEEARVAKEAEILGEVCLARGALDVLLAEAPSRQTELWNLRRSVGEAVKKISVYKEEDTVVPRAALASLVSGVKAIGARHGIRTICYGHAGDGNIHVNVLKEGIDEERWKALLPDAIREIFSLAVSLGGMISGEHGIGLTQKVYLPLALTEAELDLTRRLKQVFDPDALLNPGKILD
jgi:glycolate oxidase